MRSRSDIENDIESSYRDNEGYARYADEEKIQILTLEVLLDIRELLRV